jgi:hypothetical protein
MLLLSISKESLELLSIVLSALLVILGWLYNQRVEEMKIMRSQLSERKHKAYADLVATFYSMFKDTKNHQQTDMKTAMSKMMDSKRDIFMYGSDEVFQAFNNWLVNASQPWQFNEFLKFILCIRKDLCGKTKLTEDDILLNLIQNKDELNKFKEMMKIGRS